MVPSHVQGIYGILTEKKKICFLSWASSYIHLFWVDLWVVQGDRISSFLGEILFWFCEEFLLKLSFKFPSPGPASPSWIFWICPCLYEPLLTFDFSQRFSVNCQNLCCQSTDSQSSVVFSLGAICLHHLTIENEIRWKFCRIFTLHGYFWECKNGYFCSIQLTSLTLTALD